MANDLRQGFVCAAAARGLYDVIVHPDGSVDHAATEAEQRRIAGPRLYLRAIAEADGFRAGHVGRHRVCHINPRDAVARGLTPESIVELDTGIAARLRAWLVPDEAVASGTVPLDARGQAILRAPVGTILHPRPLRGVPAVAAESGGLA